MAVVSLGGDEPGRDRVLESVRGRCLSTWHYNILATLIDRPQHAERKENEGSSDANVQAPQ